MRACLEQDRTVAELLALTDLTAPSVSEHLKVLRKTGILDMERDGRHRRYRTRSDVVRAATERLARLT